MDFYSFTTQLVLDKHKKHPKVKLDSKRLG